MPKSLSTGFCSMSCLMASCASVISVFWPTEPRSMRSLNAASCWGLVLGVQFIGPHLDWKLLWSAGEYEFDISGWVNRKPREPEADLRTRFRAEISPGESQELNRWAEAPNSVWKLLNDPHNAVGIPVTIDKATLIVG